MDQLSIIARARVPGRSPVEERCFVIVAAQQIVNDRKSIHDSRIQRIEFESFFEVLDGVIPASLPPGDETGERRDFSAVWKGAAGQGQLLRCPVVIAFAVVKNQRL